jgi:LysR family glycine cleavage system transcriptional activator
MFCGGRERKTLRTLVQLKALQAFEVAARHGGFTAAASELGVTPAAVGQLVRTLEAWIGAPVFDRRKTGHERLVLTDAARDALGDISEGFDRLEAGLRRLRQGTLRQIVVVSGTHAIVNRWLMPNLNDFVLRHPGIDVTLDVTDRLVDVAQGEADIGVRYGPGGWRGVQSTLLMREEIFPTCSPDLAPKGPANAAWLATQSLIHDTTPVAAGVFPTWSEWLKRADIRLLTSHQGPHITSSAAVLRAALSGQGVALVRSGLAADAVAAGGLVRLFEDVRWSSPWAYFAVVSPSRLERPAVSAFHAWLLEMWARS